MSLIIKLFPEIIVKSRPVRKQFISQLRKNIKKILSRLIEKPNVQSQWDHLEIDLSLISPIIEKKIIRALQHIPGIEFILKVIHYDVFDIESIARIVIEHYQDKMCNQTFCVRAKRTGKHPFTSINIEREVGAYLLKAVPSAKVDLHHPEIRIQLELRDEKLLLVEKRYNGLGGFPIGQQESCVSLISGGFDSSVASYLMIKRGIRTHYCFFNLGGVSHERGVKEVAYHLWNLYASSHRVLFITIPFEAVVSEILDKVDTSQMGVILKRMMLRVANQVAVEFNSPGIVTGEAVGQVSSQTLTNLAVIDKVSEQLVMRPLIVMDKPDIIHLSRIIGTEPFAAVMPEYCGIISQKPTTRAKMHKIKREESYFDFSILDNAFKERKVENIDQMLELSPDEMKYEVVVIPKKEEIIIDIRHPEASLNDPLIHLNNEILLIPFFKLKNTSKLKKDVPYLLYCENGVMSHLQAESLHEKGYQVKIFQPK
jgi:thiamine biosynthesis protein ThiI